ncbi:hypothetical protein CLOM_g7181 [Closterium sp. NIES-68]|nr:hypothetical protein CLOM_g7181 [Closterium sp. NIES-68]GJP78987.1 hypothetical protein CLOP_g9244 [Closterium sp. NIES-67]
METPLPVAVNKCNQASASSDGSTGGSVGIRRTCDVLEPSTPTNGGRAAKRLRHSHTQTSTPEARPNLPADSSEPTREVRHSSATAETSSLEEINPIYPTVPPVFPELVGRLEETFDLDCDILGVGQFGTVRRCVCRATGQAFACKTIPTSRLVDQFVREEVKMEVLLLQHRLNVGQSSPEARLSAVNASSGEGLATTRSTTEVAESPVRVTKSSHGAAAIGAATGAAWQPAIVQLHAVFEDDKAVHLVMDLCDSGDLYDEVVRRGRLPEKESALLFRQIASALAFCHARGVMHRDMKPENVLLHKQGDASNRLTVKLADFGLAIPLSAGETTRGVSGSTFYMAPEVLSGEYCHSADVWSLGVILYTMLSGTVPFFGADHSESTDAVLNGRLDFSGPEWATISVEAKGLIRCMLHRDPRRRPTAAKVLSHPWVLLNVFGGRIVRRAVARPLEIAAMADQSKANVEAQVSVQQQSGELLRGKHSPEETHGHVAVSLAAERVRQQPEPLPGNGFCPEQGQTCQKHLHRLMAVQPSGFVQTSA